MPSTHESNHTGPGKTGKSNQGNWHRYDFAMLSAGLVSGGVGSWVDGKVVVQTAKTDHLPAAIRFPCQKTLARNSFMVKRRTPQVDVDALTKPAIQQATIRDIECLPRVPWQVEPTSHQHIASEQIR